MPSLMRAFENMRRRGLIAECDYYCGPCGQQRVLEQSQKWRARNKDIRGFAHLGDGVALASPDEAHVPLVFGTVAGGEVCCQGPECLAVGEVVAQCLNEEGVRHAWDRAPGNPIVVLVDRNLSGIPLPEHHHASARDDEWGGARRRL
jgi:hypothetical protein